MTRRATTEQRRRPRYSGKPKPIKIATPANRNPVQWGAAAIGAVIGRSERQTFHLLQKGKIRSARKVGAQYCAATAALCAEFGIPAEAAD